MRAALHSNAKPLQRPAKLLPRGGHWPGCGLGGGGRGRLRAGSLSVPLLLRLPNACLLAPQESQYSGPHHVHRVPRGICMCPLSDLTVVK